MRASFLIVLLVAVASITLADDREKLLQRTTPFGKRCGLLCMATVSGALGEPLNFQALAKRLPDSESGSSLEELSEAAVALGLHSSAIRCPSGLPEFGSGEVCAILPVKPPQAGNHFVVAIYSSKGVVSILDFPGGMMRLTERSLRGEYAWDGTALLVAKSNQPLESLTRPSSAFWLWCLGSALCFAVVVGLLLLQKRKSHAT